MEFIVLNQNETLRNLVIAGITIVLGCSASAATSTVTSISAKAGSHTGEVKSLAASNEGKIVTFTTGESGLEIELQVPVSGLGQNLSVVTSVKQRRAQDVLTLQARDATGAWLSVASISQQNSYRILRFSLPSAAIVEDRVTLRLISNSGADAGSMDYLILDNQVTASAPASTEPAPKPVSISGGERLKTTD